MHNYRSGKEELYNLVLDSGEKTDLAASDAQTLQTMRQGLQTFRDLQFSYYLGDPQRQKDYFPPHFDRLRADLCQAFSMSATKTVLGKPILKQQ